MYRDHAEEREQQEKPERHSQATDGTAKGGQASQTTAGRGTRAANQIAASPHPGKPSFRNEGNKPRARADKDSESSARHPDRRRLQRRPSG